MLTQEKLKEILTYNPTTGEFISRCRTGGTIVKGSVLGHLHKASGYIFIMINYKNYRAHRLAFLYMEGAFPDKDVDHKDRIRSNNIWSNLRHVTARINNENKVTNCSFIGVNWDKSRCKWKVKSPSIKGKSTTLGRYNTHLAACYARWVYDQSLCIRP